jgi:tyrosine-protein kinase Etk/Wzc
MNHISKDTALTPSGNHGRSGWNHGHRHQFPNGKNAEPRVKADEEAALDLEQVWLAIRRGKWIIALTCLIVTGLIATYTLSLDPIYEASSIVAVSTQQSRSGSLFGIEETRALSNEVGVLTNSLELSERVVHRLQEAAAALGTNEHYPLLMEGESGTTSRKLAIRLMKRMNFAPQPDRDLVGIYAESTAPEEATAIANFYAEEYERYTRETSRASIAAARSFLEDQTERRYSELQDLERQWESFAREKEVIIKGPEGERVVAEYAGLGARRDEAQFNLEQERASLRLLQEQLEQVQPGLQELVFQEQAASELENEILAIDQRLASLKIEAEQYYAVDPSLRGKEDRVPELKEITRLIARFSTRKTELTNRLIEERLTQENVLLEGGQLDYVARLRSRIMEKQLAIRELEIQVRALDQRLGGYQTRLQSIPRQAIEREQLERRIEQAERWYNMFAEQLQQTLVAEESELGYVRIIRSAFVPTVPVRPNLRQNVILGLLLGLGFGIGLAFMQQAMSKQLTNPEDLKQRGYNLVGTIPVMDREIESSYDGKETVEVAGQRLSTRLFMLLNPWSSIAENYRLIRTNLEYEPGAAPIQVMMVTSPEQADGKSVTAMNLAIATAQSGRKTLVVDADMRRPSAHTLLGVGQGPGLADILSGKLNFEPERFKTAIDQLSFLPAGNAVTPPAEMVGSQRMRDLIETFRATYDLVILDVPPVLAVSDALVMGTLGDATIIVVSANKTDLRALQATQNALIAVGARVAGTVLNRLDARKAGPSQYGYGYGYNGSYYTQQEH